jgi:hypothetical protein
MPFISSAIGFAPLVAAADAIAPVMEFDLPESTAGAIFFVLGALLALTVSVGILWRDTAEQSRFWRGWLLTLRLSVLLGLLVVAINPQERTQQLAYRPSQVAVLVDRSLSMQFPESQPASPDAPANPRSRADAIGALLKDSELIANLRKNHSVSIYSFDSALNGPHHSLRTLDPRAVVTARNVPTDATAPVPDEAAPDWQELVRPVGLETRLGESLVELIRQISSKSLSGIVLLTDGGSNAGIDPQAAIELARTSRTRLAAVGVGSIQQPVNLQIAALQAPSDVHAGDSFEVTAYVQSQGLSGKKATIELLSKPEEVQGEPTLLASKEVDLLDDGLPTKVTFERSPTESGRFEFFVRAKPVVRVIELSESDNERRKAINVVDRKTKVLIVAGGPMRDYQFVRNMLFRHSAIDTDIWLQSADSNGAISQESDSLLSSFPTTKEKLFEYDVLLAFDPNWKRLNADQFALLHEWVFSQAAGVIFIAGDVYSPDTASAPELSKIRELYPTVLNPILLDSGSDLRNAQPWPIQFTREGSEAGFLQVTDDPVTSALMWKGFPGLYGCYPTNGAKAGATVYAFYGDPRVQTNHGQPVLLASQYYGSGRILYLGSPELWRLRANDEDFYDRFWTKSIREVGQARLKRGNNRGTIIVERTQYVLGQTVRVRAQVLDPQFTPITDSGIEMEVFDPSGKPLSPPLKTQPDSTRAGQHVASFRVSQPGTWRIELPIPQSRERVIEKLDVVLPNLETDNARQNVQLLRQMADDTGGGYFTIAEAATEVPKKLPNMGEEFQIDQQLKSLWDREWVMYLLIALLSIEWLTRKLLKLA